MGTDHHFAAVAKWLSVPIFPSQLPENELLQPRMTHGAVRAETVLLFRYLRQFLVHRIVRVKPRQPQVAYH